MVNVIQNSNPSQTHLDVILELLDDKAVSQIMFQANGGLSVHHIERGLLQIATIPGLVMYQLIGDLLAVGTLQYCK